MSNLKNDFLPISIVFLTALLAGFLSLIFLPEFPVSGDAQSFYLPVAESLREGKGFLLDGEKLPPYRTPAYPSFLALTFTLFGENFDAVRIIQFFFLATIGIFAYLIARKCFQFSSLHSLLVSLFVACWPYIVVYAGLIRTEIPFIFFFIPAIYFFLRTVKTPKIKFALLSGFLFAAASLVRFITLLLPLFLFAILFLLHFRLENKKPVFTNKKTLLFEALFVLAFLASLAPWAIYNDMLQFQTVGFFFHDDVEKDSVFNILEQFRVDRALMWFHPGAYIEGQRTSLLMEKYPFADKMVLAYRALYFLILAGALLSLAFLKERWKEIILLFGIIFYFWLADNILSPTVLPRPRYMLPLVPLMILLAFFTLNHFQKLKSLFKKT